MFQIVIMAAAAVQVVGVACYVVPARPYHVFFLQFTPTVTAAGLSVLAFGRYMGWPI